MLGACSSDDSSSQNAASTGGAGNSGGASGATGTGSASGTGGSSSGGAAGTSACEPATYADEALQLGEKLFNGVTLPTSTPIAEIIAAPADFESKVVRVEGFIVTICEDQGCYVTLQNPAADQLNLKVVDGVLDFRLHSSLGNYAIGEGVSQQAGEHGAQIFIQDHGAVIGPSVCSVYAAK
jgi:hypothetical protein